jgi:uncharacterized protein
MSARVYVDTSVLAKWYLNEPWSEEVEAWLQDQGVVAISTLSLVEMTSLLARRRRMGQIDEALEARIGATIEADVSAGFLVRHEVNDRTVREAGTLIRRLPGHPLRTLDALHLALAAEIGGGAVATADRVMADVIRALGWELIPFGLG